ncbi:MAG: APC family permease [Actinomycetota bacterium]|nr:APC family permease [Actinomycetota bacterium]
MVGAGVFAAVGPAAAAAGAGLLAGLVVAGAVAYCNAASSAQLAAVYPQSGGTYVYGRRRLGRFWGYLAGWGFVVGKTASCAAMALTFGAYAAPVLARPLGVVAVTALTTVNHLGVRKSTAVTRVLVAVVLVSLAAVVVAALFGGQASLGRLALPTDLSPSAVLQAAGLLFFAFAGYARVATLGEEVVDPARTIPRAVPLALGITLVVYATVAVAALAAVGPSVLASAEAPLAEAASHGTLAALAPAVRVGGTVASLSVLLSLLVGVSRTVFAMASTAELPRTLAAVHGRTRVPHRAQLAVAAAVCVLVLVADLRHAIGFSSFAVLVYYGIANAAAWTLPADQRRWPRALSAAGLAGCAALAFSLPPSSVATGVAVLGGASSSTVCGSAGGGGDGSCARCGCPA